MRNNRKLYVIVYKEYVVFKIIVEIGGASGIYKI